MTVRVSYVIGLALLLVAAGAVGAGADQTQDITRYQEPRNLVELVENPDREFIIVDVRTPVEYRSGHIPGAVNIDHREITARPPEVSKDTLVVTYCRSGARATVATAALERLGYEKVVNFGAVSSWPKELVTGDDPR